MYDLDNALAHIDRQHGVRKTDLSPGDLVLISTRNSVYTIRVRGDGSYRVSGGWFDQRGRSPVQMTILGCSWSGRALMVDWVAAPGLHVVFGNQVTTSTIKKVWVFRAGAMN